MDFGLESSNPGLAEAIKFDYRTAQLEPADRALCDYAAKLTVAPGAVGPADILRLRSHGFGDEAIALATQVIGYFNYITRIAEGLGVDPEEWMQPPPAEWRRRKGRGYASVPGATAME
jgi:uncharacterized peroxidase-related enzyme